MYPTMCAFSFLCSSSFQETEQTPHTAPVPHMWHLYTDTTHRVTHLCPHAIFPSPTSACKSSDWHCLRHMASSQLWVLMKQEPGWCPDPYGDGCYLPSQAVEGAWIEPCMSPGWPMANLCRTSRWRSACGQLWAQTWARTGAKGAGPIHDQVHRVWGLEPQLLAP